LMDEKKSVYEGRLSIINVKLDLTDLDSKGKEFSDKVIEMHNSVLEREIKVGKQLEFAPEQIDVLKECLIKIESILDGTNKPSAEIVDHIKKQINSCPNSGAYYLSIFEYSTWENLYRMATNGNPNVDEWTEEQFGNFLMNLKMFIE